MENSKPKMPINLFCLQSSGPTIVSFAAVIRVVTQRSSPLTAVSGEERCVMTLIMAAKETTQDHDGDCLP